MARWIEKIEITEKLPWKTRIICSKCGFKWKGTRMDKRFFFYCPNCGVKMEDV